MIVRVIYIASLLLCVLCARAQNVKRTTFFDKEEKKVHEVFHLNDSNTSVLDGVYISYYFNGSIEKKGSYKNNMPEGVWEYRYENGQMKMVGPVKEGKNQGFWRYFYETGKKRMEGNVQDGSQNGIWVYYYYNGKMKSKGRFLAGEKVADWEYYNEEEQVVARASYANGEALYNEFYNSNKLYGVGLKVNKKKEGDWVYYHENGTVLSRGKYTAGKKVGSWKYYYESGVLESEGAFNKGTKKGKWKRYHENGKTKSEGEYSNDKRNGNWSIFDQFGKIESKGAYKNGTGKYQSFYESGSVKIEGYFKEDQYDSLWSFYDENGTKVGECLYNKDKGNYVGFYPSGKLKMKGTLDKEKKVGTWELYHENGTLAGYFRPVYEPTSVVSAPKNPKVKYGVGKYRYKKKDNKYFKKGINEFVGIYAGLDAFSHLIGRIPITGEMYFQERLGYQVELVLIKAPFYKQFNNLSNGEIGTTGLEFSFKQKFYNPDELFGMWYFGHQIVFNILSHETEIKRDPLDLETIQVQANESKFQYGIIVGYRYLIDTKNKGWSLDGYLGVNVGYRQFKVNEIDRVYFEKLPQKKFALTPAVSISIGYMFSQNKKKRK